MDRVSPVIIHANDLAAGLAVALARPGADTKVIYDAHELEVHRNRRTGWLRILIEHEQERLVIAAATETRTVNTAVARTMAKLHPSLAELPRIVPNDLYEHHDVAAASALERPALVCVGRGLRGRRLEQLDREPAELGFEVCVWPLGGVMPRGVVGRHWRIGPDDYESSLLSTARERRCLMWCCVDSSALSYRLATPNKFFQALAVCMPVVASPGTYLSELVEAHGIGPISDGSDFPALRARVLSEEYVGWVNNVRRLRARIRDGSVVV